MNPGTIRRLDVEFSEWSIMRANDVPSEAEISEAANNWACRLLQTTESSYHDTAERWLDRTRSLAFALWR